MHRDCGDSGDVVKNLEVNGLKNWVIRSREEQRKAPERYLASYPDLVMDETRVLLTKEQLEKIDRYCGRYESTFPTGVFLGRMFIRGDLLCWFGIDKNNPMTNSAIKFRLIEVID